MRVFLDFEASSLADDSYPIEVGWITEEGEGESHLIRPAPGWTDWDEEAETIHGISRERLAADGVANEAVAHRVLEVLGHHQVYVSAPSWDGKWLSVLLRSAGLPRHAMRFRDSDEAHLEAARDALGASVPEERMELEAARLVEEARQAVAAGPPRHRALADAQQERDIWLEVRRRGAART